MMYNPRVEKAYKQVSRKLGWDVLDKSTLYSFLIGNRLPVLDLTKSPTRDASQSIREGPRWESKASCALYMRAFITHNFINNNHLYIKYCSYLLRVNVRILLSVKYSSTLSNLGIEPWRDLGRSLCLMGSSRQYRLSKSLLMQNSF